jgi:hypothetical protein
VEILLPTRLDSRLGTEVVVERLLELVPDKQEVLVLRVAAGHAVFDGEGEFIARNGV